MIYAKEISFNRGDEKRLETIVKIYLSSSNAEGVDGWYSKEAINDWIHDDSNEIVVNIDPFPKLIPVDGEKVKYVRSTKDNTDKDNLLKLSFKYED